VELRIEVSTAVFNNHETKIGVSSFEQSGEDHAACRDSVKNQRINIVGAKNHGEIGASKRTNPMLSDNDFTVFGGR
jgi:hypothetical protein